MDTPLRKVTARLDVKAQSSRPPSPAKHSPTSSPSPSAFRPRAKVNTATVRKLSSSSSLHHSRSNNVPLPPRSRPGSPFKPSRVVPNASEPSSSPKARVMARPTSRSEIGPVLLEPRQRALTTASAKLKFPQPEDRPRSGSVIALHHALSISDINASSSPTLSQPPSPLVDIRRMNTPPALVPIKVKSKVTGIVKAMSVNPDDAISRSLSPPYATTRPIHARARAPSITSSFSSNEPPSSSFYPITTASPAANPHRYTPRRPQSPARCYPPLVPRVDPASVPLPPRSPPLSALSLSSKSSVSRTSASLTTDQTTDNQTSTIVSHVKRRSIERAGQPNLFFSQAEITVQTKRDRSRSKERSPRDLVARGESDTDSDGSERHLKAEAKTNRKIADLEITNRSLLAINASLESTKNRQAKEMQSLRRKLRESRLILPPRTYKDVKSTLEDERDRDDDEADDDSDAEEADETFQRVRGLIENLLESGKRALEMRPEDFRASLATKVLNADELRSWRDSGQRPSIRNNYMDTQDADDKTMQGLPALVTMPNTSLVDSDGEPAPNSQSLALPPTLTITHSL